ncbi:hypothetical protein [Sphingomonas sp. NIC1]|uniref:hypothetical protein n=1 Tax=Sphingomonas sp. NIC1 TaxID=1961362 RepID=UPI001CF6E347|nr:hypothetical protein [Sphingomonas sp. NIC1]
MRTATFARDYQLAYSPQEPIALFLTGVTVVALAVRLQPAMVRIIPSRAAIRLGLATYPLYLIHQAAGAVVIAWLMAAGLPYYPAAILVAGIALGFALWCAAVPEPQLRARIARVRLPRAPAPDSLPIAFLRGG